jgi:hypothetical protein
MRECSRWSTAVSGAFLRQPGEALRHILQESCWNRPHSVAHAERGAIGIACINS